MLKFKSKTLVLLAGIIWIAIGTILLSVGLNYLVNHPPVFTPSGAAPILIALALILGAVKGRFVLSRSAKRNCERLSQIKTPAPLHQIFPPPFYFLIALMMLLGISMTYFELAPDIRGVVDVAVGAALINGAVAYFKAFSKPAAAHL